MAKNLLKGSEREPMPGAKSTGNADPTERLEVTVLLRRSNADAFRQRVSKLSSRTEAREHLTRGEFDRQFGASNADIAAVRQFAAAHGISVVQERAGRRSVVLSGTVEQFNAAFDVELERYEYPVGSYRGRVGAIYLPDELSNIVDGVLGLDDRPAARAHFRDRSAHRKTTAHAAAASATSYTPLQIASFYNFPSGTGKGECVGIIELGGGEKHADLKTYFGGLGISPSPKVTVVSVDHAKNHPTGSVDGPDGEVMMDIEVVGSIAPEAHIAVYFAPNTSAGFLDAITTAIHDTTNSPSVISISWGGAESTWTQQALAAYDSAFQAAATLGITVCVASGDNGSSDGGTGDNVDFPASSPHALACGGTSIQTSGNKITGETVWNDGTSGGAGGGGVSKVFAVPAWQEGLSATKTTGGAAPLTMRGVPDVSGDADPETGWDVRVDGSNAVFGGTSAVAPLWAGLIARINAANTEAGVAAVGLINPALYGKPSVLNDITKGNNGDFEATKGWDACTGLGSPDGTAIATLLA